MKHLVGNFRWNVCNAVTKTTYALRGYEYEERLRRLGFFVNREPRWNELPNEVKESKSVNEFKNKYDNCS